MRQFLLTASLIFTFGLAACADHAGSIATLDTPTPTPIGPSDGDNLSPVPGSPANNPSPTPGGGGGFNPGTPAGTEPGGGKGGSGGGGKGGGGKGGGGSGGGGSPVPEPGTLLLVGTGLAGAALMRRRQKADAVAQ